MSNIRCITEFGAIAGREALQTRAIQSAIDACFLAGGGEVTVPAGVFRTGGLRLRSGVTLHLLSHAVLVGSRDPQDYTHFFEDTLEETLPIDAPEIFAHVTDERWNNALLRAYLAHDVAVIGDEGSVIDGQNVYDAQGEEGFRGPHGISFFRCRNIELRGYTVRDSGNWAHIFLDCRCIYIRDVHVRGGHDGIHLRACNHALIEDCTLYTGDDSIAGYNNRGVAVLRCELNSSCSNFRFGGTDVLIDRCRMFGPGLYGHRMTLPLDAKIAGLPTTPTNSRHNTLTAFLYFCTKNITLRETAGNIVMQNCVIEGVDRLFEQDFSIDHIWCGGQGLADITFRNCYVTGVRKPFCSVSNDCEHTKIRIEQLDISSSPDRVDQPVFDIGNAESVCLVRVRTSGYDCPTLRLRSGEECRIEQIECSPMLEIFRG